MKILTTFGPLHDVVVQLTKTSSEFRVTNLAPAPQGPHDFDLTSQHKEAVQKADAILTLYSLNLGEKFDRIYPTARAWNIRLVNLDPAKQWKVGAPPMALLQDPVDSASNKQPHGNNPHVWLSLGHMMQMTTFLSRDLQQLCNNKDSKRKIQLQEAKLKKAMNKLRAEALMQVAKMDVPPLGSLTEAFPYFTQDLGLPVVDYILADLSTDALRKRMQKNGLKLLITEESPSEEYAKVFRELGVYILVLDPMERGLLEQGFLNAYQENVNRLLKAVGDISKIDHPK